MTDSLKELLIDRSGSGASADAIHDVVLPTRKSEEYKFTPITKELERSIQSESVGKSAPDDSVIPDGLLDNCNKLTFLNGHVVEQSVKETIEILDLSNVDAPMEMWNDPFHQLNTSISRDGIHIRIPKGTVIGDPIYIRYVIDASTSQSVAFSKVYIHAGENSEVTVVEHYEYVGENNSFDSTESHFLLEQNARVKAYSLQLEGKSQIHVGNSFIYQHRDSNFNSVAITLSGKMIRNNVQAWQKDEHCETHLFGLYMIQGKDHVDNHTTVDHMKPNSYSNELYKGILDENSTGVFNGKIYVRPNAQQTNAFQSNNNLLLSDSATLHTKPQLEIWADDVKCSHGCTSGQLDDEAMFYLRTRGLNKTQARAIMLKAFVAEILEQIKVEEISKTVEKIVDTRLFKI